MSMLPESKERMEAFVLHAGRLKHNRYSKHVIENKGMGFNLKVDKVESTVEMTHNFPDEEMRDATTNVLRMFVQNNDSVSIGNMSCLLDDPDISEGWKERFLNARTQLNNFLKVDTGFRFEGKAYSNYELRELFMYGYVSHSSPKKAKTMKALMAEPLFPFAEYLFHGIVVHHLKTINFIAEFCRRELEGEQIQPMRMLDSVPQWFKDLTFYPSMIWYMSGWKKGK